MRVEIRFLGNHLTQCVWVSWWPNVLQMCHPKHAHVCAGEGGREKRKCETSQSWKKLNSEYRRDAPPFSTNAFFYINLRSSGSYNSSWPWLPGGFKSFRRLDFLHKPLLRQEQEFNKHCNLIHACVLFVKKIINPQKHLPLLTMIVFLLYFMDPWGPMQSSTCVCVCVLTCVYTCVCTHVPAHACMHAAGGFKERTRNK